MADKVNNGGGNKWLTAAWTAVTVIILLAPLIAMQFTADVNWTVGDFVFAGAMLLGAGITYELAARVGGFAYQAGVVVALGTGILTFWTTGAVGIIGSENNPGNLLYLAVVALAIAGAILTQGQASRMVWTMGLAAIATLTVPLFANYGIADPVSDVIAPEVFIATAVLAAGWTLSAFFFRKASQR
ncbi:MAG: hypothetical protein AB7H66_13675 [Hyphomonadaceae bacterium]